MHSSVVHDHHNMVRCAVFCGMICRFNVLTLASFEAEYSVHVAFVSVSFITPQEWLLIHVFKKLYIHSYVYIYSYCIYELSNSGLVIFFSIKRGREGAANVTFGFESDHKGPPSV